MLLMCFLLVTCSSLTSPSNGRINCLLGGNGIPNPEETCTVTCNTGYELMGNSIRTCQNNGTWTGISAACLGGPCNSCNMDKRYPRYVAMPEA